MRFIRDYLQHKKLLIKAADVKAYNVPPYEELSVKAIFAQVKGDEEILQYLNYYPDVKELPEHGFFYSVLGTLHPNYVVNLINAANRKRNKKDTEDSRPEQIAITQDILEMLEDEPYLSSKDNAFVMIAI